MDLRKKIIVAAYELFAEKGYDNTTVSDIIKKVGSSRGGFYHHFNGKDEILLAITENYIKDLIKYYKEILMDTESSVIYSINQVIVKINKYKLEQVGEWPNMRRVFSFHGNHTIIRKLAEQFDHATTEVYTKLFLRGIDEGVFAIPHVELLAGLWTREITGIYGMATKVIYSEKKELFKAFEDLLDFSENLFNMTLGLAQHPILLKEGMLQYMETARNQNIINQEGDHD